MAKSFFFSASSVLAVDALLPKVWLLNAFHSVAKPEEVLTKMGAHCAKSASVDATTDVAPASQNASASSGVSLDSVPRPRPIVCEFRIMEQEQSRLTRCCFLPADAHPLACSVWPQWSWKVYLGQETSS